MKLIELADHSEDSRRVSPEKMLRETLKEPLSDNFNKAILLLIDDRDDKYNFGFRNAGMSMSEAVALLSIAKHHMTRYIIGGRIDE